MGPVTYFPAGTYTVPPPAALAAWMAARKPSVAGPLPSLGAPKSRTLNTGSAHHADAQIMSSRPGTPLIMPTCSTIRLIVNPAQVYAIPEHAHRNDGERKHVGARFENGRRTPCPDSPASYAHALARR